MLRQETTAIRIDGKDVEISDFDVNTPISEPMICGVSIIEGNDIEVDIRIIHKSDEIITYKNTYATNVKFIGTSQCDGYAKLK